MPTRARSITSPKVTALLQVLIDGAEHTTWELSRRAELCDVATLMRELRLHGLQIPRVQHRSNHHYRLSTVDYETLAQLRPDMAGLIGYYRQDRRETA